MTLQVNEPSAKYLVRPQSNNDEAGIPPSGWQIKPLGELSEFITSGSRGWASYYKEHGATFIRSQNVLKGQLDFNDHQCVVPPVGSEGSRTRVEFGDLLITITGNSVGNVAYVDRPLGEAYISQHVGLVRLKESESAAYICRFLSPGAPGNSQIVSNQSGQSKPGLNLKNLRDFVVSIPPKEEQLAIAAALSDVDTLIAGLEKLIAKKRDLKQAAMQQLLTGQTRLPGFSGDWDSKMLGDIAHIQKGQLITTETLVAGSIPVVAGGKKPAYFHNKPNRLGKTITVSASGASAGYVAFHRSAIFASDCSTISEAKSYCIEFLYFSLQLQQEKIYSAQTGGAQPHIQPKDLSPLPVLLPIALDEQQTIAKVLCDMEDELAALESRLAKTRDLKQGMMQELLTGRTRLV